MSPFEHGEVFVLNDGGEADLDLGNYERFLDVTLTRDHNLTTGKVYSKVIDAERRGDYLGKTVQVIPHVTDAIQEWLARVSRIAVDSLAGEGAPPPDVCLIEVGGTVGDIESLVFLEALRQFQFRVRGAPPPFFAPRSARALTTPPPPPPPPASAPPGRSARPTFASCTCRSSPCSGASASRRRSRRSTVSRSCGPSG